MPRIIHILLQDPLSGVTLAKREDSQFIVGLCLTKGAEHSVQELVDYYLGPDEQAAFSAFERMTAPHKDVDTTDQ